MSDIRPTFAYVDLRVLAENYRILQKAVGQQVSILAVVKADLERPDWRELASDMEDVFDLTDDLGPAKVIHIYLLEKVYVKTK